MEGKEAQELLDSGMVQVFDIELVRHFLHQGKHTSLKTYDVLTRIIAEVGALWIPFRELPQVKKAMEVRDDRDSY